MAASCIIGHRGWPERRFGSFERVFTVPETVRAERIEATVADGVLRLTLPKAEKAQPRAISIKAA